MTQSTLVTKRVCRTFLDYQVHSWCQSLSTRASVPLSSEHGKGIEKRKRTVTTNRSDYKIFRAASSEEMPAPSRGFLFLRGSPPFRRKFGGIGNSKEAQHSSCTAFTGQMDPCWQSKQKGEHCLHVDCRECTVYTEFGECHRIKRKLQELMRPAIANSETVS